VKAILWIALGNYISCRFVPKHKYDLATIVLNAIVNSSCQGVQSPFLNILFHSFTLQRTSEGLTLPTNILRIHRYGLKIQLEEFSMSMSISAVGSGGGGGFDPAKMASRIASKMMSDLDPNSTGKVTTDQFISGMAAKGISSADATRMYDSIDTKKTGSIGKTEIEAAINSGNLKPPAGGPKGGPHARVALWFRKTRWARRCGWSWWCEQFLPNLCRSRHEQRWCGFRTGSSNLRDISSISGSFGKYQDRSIQVRPER
jgi:hypothetical protein